MCVHPKFPSWKISDYIQAFASARRKQPMLLFCGRAVSLYSSYISFPFHGLWQSFSSIPKLLYFKGLVEISPLPEIPRKPLCVWVALSLWERQGVTDVQIRSKRDLLCPTGLVGERGCYRCWTGALGQIHQLSYFSFLFLRKIFQMVYINVYL